MRRTSVVLWRSERVATGATCVKPAAARIGALDLRGVEIAEVRQRALVSRCKSCVFRRLCLAIGPGGIKERDGHGLGGGAFQSQLDAAKHLTTAFSESTGDGRLMWTRPTTGLQPNQWPDETV
jgi:hypothetical protein